MINKSELEELKKILLAHCFSMGILRSNAEDKKKKAIVDSLVISVVNTGLSIQDVKDCIKDVEKDEVINLNFFKKGGNLFRDYVKQRWVEFAKELFTQRSVGLGTPNAASGEGELMFLFLSKKIKKPTRGDLEVDGEIIELKGERGVRVMSEVRGKDFRKRTLEICREYNLTPNKAYRTNLDAVELEKSQHLTHWKKELSKLQLNKQKEFINKWLSCLDGEDHNKSVEKVFEQNSFNYDLFVKEIIKILYKITVRTGNFDKFIILGDGTNSKIISKDEEDFNKKVDTGEIVPQTDYFRINQNYNVGWYIS
ncbi:MAG: hypothetical protein QXG86_02560 [Candidatus Woesearchaeota archaeon]